MNQPFSDSKKIGLALSGGGVRAAAFHAGILKWLAEQGKLEEITHISSVSGGSLFVGLVFNFSDYSWPTSEKYLQTVYPRIKEILTQKNLLLNSVCRLILNPFHWKFIFSRANIVAQSIDKYWGIKGTLGQLPDLPIWSINGTTAENGKRFRFKNSTGGDYEIGYADFSHFSLAKAMAVSAAFPGGIGPFALETLEYKWFKYKSSSELVPQFKSLHIYDGGLYDNLGMEPLFDIGKRRIKKSAGDINFIIVSDAGAPLARKPIKNLFRLLRLKRFMDIVMDQTRALRVRSFVSFLLRPSSNGMYLKIGSNPISKIQEFSSEVEIDKGQWLSTEEVHSVSLLPTTLSKMTEESFDMAARHGYETVKWNEIVFNK